MSRTQRNMFACILNRSRRLFATTERRKKNAAKIPSSTFNRRGRGEENQREGIREGKKTTRKKEKERKGRKEKERKRKRMRGNENERKQERVKSVNWCRIIATEMSFAVFAAACNRYIHIFFPADNFSLSFFLFFVWRFLSTFLSSSSSLLSPAFSSLLYLVHFLSWNRKWIN